jgi:hypothetical protein
MTKKQIDQLTDFQLYLKNKGLINDFDWDFEKESIEFLTTGNGDDVYKAKKLLEDNGYFVKNLWHVADILIYRKDCPRNVAQDILNRSLTDASTFNHVWELINSIAKEKGYEF